MRLTHIYLRFFRSFNYDYERKAHPDASRPDWAKLEGRDYPFIRVPVDPVVTAVVGANESGKSHLIAATKQALTGHGIDRSDFCRYSALFSVERGGLRDPDLGIEVEVEKSDLKDIPALAAAVKAGDRIKLLRFAGGDPIVLRASDDPLELTPEELKALVGRLPLVATLETRVAVPDNVSYDALRNRKPGPLGTRSRRSKLKKLLDRLGSAQEELASNAAEIVSAITDEPPEDVKEIRAAEEEMARSLLFKVGCIDPSIIGDLEAAVQDGKEGRAKALEGQMNATLARHLNFARVWRQDRDFRLLLDAHEHGLSFTVHDRTGRSYSFDERSQGLRYFLSYYVQLLGLERPEARSQLLLVDEPDAYLSSAGQQDLLQILEQFARPDDGSRRDQVVYVTHSPFLINKNAAHRIRVLDKGSNDQGTRVVRDVARNHYEPLRSALGEYVAETAFIGGANLVVEGSADQILLAGLSSRLRNRKSIPPSELLDLNEVTLVTAGGAPSVPYVVYLARGRDRLKPPCVALLDGDTDGLQAVKRLRKADVDGKELLADRFIVQLAEWAETTDLHVSDDVLVREIEDLIPTAVVAHAAQGYARRLIGLDPASAEKLNKASIDAELKDHDGSVFDALRAAAEKAFEGAHIDKVGLAREVISYLNELKPNANPSGVKELDHNFRMLVSELALRLEAATREESQRRRGKELDRLTREFVTDYPDGVQKDKANLFLRRIDGVLESGDAADEAVRSELAAIRGEFKLEERPLEQVADFAALQDRVLALPVIEREGPQQDATL